jgi:hypothetical protein
MNDSPLDRRCPHCLAEPDQPCRRGKSTQGHHAARLAPIVRGDVFAVADNLARSRATGAMKSAAARRRRRKRTIA